MTDIRSLEQTLIDNLPWNSTLDKSEDKTCSRTG